MSLKIRNSNSSWLQSNTGGLEPGPTGRSRRRNSGCGKATCGGDLAVRSRRSVQGMIAKGLSSKHWDARFWMNILAPRPSNKM